MSEMSRRGNMDMKIRTLGRHIMTAGKNTMRNGWMTFASVSSVAVTLFILGIFLVVMLNMDYFMENVERDLEIQTFVEIGAEKEDLERIQKQIENIPGIGSVEFSSKAENTCSKKMVPFGRLSVFLHFVSGI